MSGDEDSWREVEDLVECLEEGEFGGVSDLARRFTPSRPAAEGPVGPPV